MQSSSFWKHSLNPCFGAHRQIYCHGVGAIHLKKPVPKPKKPMATGTKGELANVNTCASTWPHFLTWAMHVVFQSRKTKRGPIEQ
jgi:hypothetical protein